MECNLAHRRSVAALCMLFKIKSNPMHPLSGALPLPYLSARVTRGAFVTYRQSLRLLAVELLNSVEPLCPSQCHFGTILVTLYLMVWDRRVLRTQPMLSCWPNLLFLFVSYYFLFFFLPSVGSTWLYGVGVFELIECFHSLSSLHY